MYRITSSELETVLLLLAWYFYVLNAKLAECKTRWRLVWRVEIQTFRDC
jgi:hypothetical protein